MNHGKREECILRAIERDLALSDPRLTQLFIAFTLRAGYGYGTWPRAERIRARPEPRVMYGRCLTGQDSGPDWRTRLRDTLRGVAVVAALACAMFLTGFGRGMSRVLMRW